MKKLIKITSAIALLAIISVSCQKESNIAPQQQANENTGKAVTEALVGTGTLTGNCSTPSGGSWGAIDYELNSLTQGVSGQVQFIDRFNASLKVNSGFYAYILNTSDAADGVTRAEIVAGALTTTGTVGFNNNNLGWYDYPTQQGPVVTPDRVVVVSNSSTKAGITTATQVYVLKLKTVGYTACTPGQFKGALSFDVAKP